MTVGKPGLVMLKFALPMAIGNILQQLYNVSDTIIIGKFLGEKSLAAVGSAANVTFLLVTLTTGLGSGVSVIVSNYFGAKKTDKLKTALFTGLISSAAAGLMLTVIFIAVNDKLLRVLNTPDEIFDSVQSYLTIYTYGILFIFIFNICNAFFQALGDSKTPLYILVFSTVLNVVLDLLFICRLDKGISGAAYATVIAEFISMVISLIIMYFQLRKIRYVKEFSHFDFKELLDIGHVAVPSILQQSVISLSIMIMQTLINSYGTVVIAAYTSATKIVNIIGSPMANMGNAVSTFAAQNIGAGKKTELILVSAQR